MTEKRSSGVASFTDAWIETTTWLMPLILSPVASFTDAWIETAKKYPNLMKVTSHLLQMRGLKLWVYGGLILCKWSHLLQMRGLKPV